MVAASVVVPVYNEEGVIRTLVEDLERVLPGLVGEFETIVVDDASTDGTPALLDELARTRPWLRVVHAEHNAGHGSSVMRGLHLARGDWIFQIDSDGQFVVAEFERLWELRDDCDLVLGVRARRRDPLHRLVLTRVVQAGASLLAGHRVRDVNTPFRLVRKTVWIDCSSVMARDTLAPNVLVAVAAFVRGWRVRPVPVTHLPRSSGRSTLRWLRLVRFSARGLRQLVAFRYRLAREPDKVAVPASHHA
jgi:glycosyltransferase involved in cell wall biosynthesis